jgi:hypothetical protein
MSMVSSCHSTGAAEEAATPAGMLRAVQRLLLHSSMGRRQSGRKEAPSVWLQLAMTGRYHWNRARRRSATPS